MCKMLPSKFRTWLLFLLALLFCHADSTNSSSEALSRGSLTAQRTQKYALLFSCLQCISETDPETAEIREINRNFNPRHHMHEYKQKEDVEILLRYIEEIEEAPEKITEPYTNAPESLAQVLIILDPLFANADNWGLFYNTSAWLLGRVNNARLYWALHVIAREKFSTTIVTPTVVEVFPQLFINKREVAQVAGVTVTPDEREHHPLLYWTGDPGLNEFHSHWHMDNPFWWDEVKYDSIRDRTGELFLYMHWQIVARYNSELVSNGMTSYVEPIGLTHDYTFPEAYYPDVMNINFRSFPIRTEGEELRDWDDGNMLPELKKWYDRFYEGIGKGYLIRTDFSRESLEYENATDIVGRTMEPNRYTLNEDFYGTFHNYFHRLLGGLVMPRGATPGIDANLDTGMRDPVFYRMHRLINILFFRLKAKAKPYTEAQLNFPGIKINSAHIITPDPITQTSQRDLVTTYFKTDSYDISTAARMPCRGVGEEPTMVEVQILNYHTFNYSISVTSTRSTPTWGMGRIFLLPSVGPDGQELDIEQSRYRAIHLDIFRMELSPGTQVITRSSTTSSISRKPIPGIKALYNSMNNPFAPDGVLSEDMKRACGWPYNLLIPRGTPEGLRFKLFVMISEEPGIQNRTFYPNWGYCGMLNGHPYPDFRPMGFPFDRPGNRFDFKNMKQTPIIIQHREVSIEDSI